jgi:hypothetical protein
LPFDDIQRKVEETRRVGYDAEAIAEAARKRLEEQ